ncbi:MAG: isoleucine--tRNA ligase, partial [Thermoprotei archaeon]
MSLTKYDPKLVESKVIESWSSKNIYLKIRQKNRGKKKFYFLDGPPYPSSDVIHVGTGWNKVLKDLVIRFRRMQGYDVWDKPGYDCHGLPIEVAVEKMLGFKSKKDIEKYGRDKFVKKCRELVERNVRSMTERFKDLGVFMDWDDPYLTLRNKYIESGWWLVKKAHEKGLLKKGVKVMHWCPRCQTVLSDYEVKEYKDLEDPSIYVKFPVEGNEGEYIVVWTTTPWTLPGNVAVMVNPKFEYAKVEFKGERLIIALDRVKDVLGPIGDFKVLETFRGEKLKGLKYVYPLSEEVPLHNNLKNAHYVILSERYVRTEEGTGCVHTAPGHGEEDFEVGLEYNLPILSPINDEGVFTKEGGKYAGLYVKEANNVIIKDLKDKGLLLRHETIVHKYPVCWRCKTPLIFRATQQWFIEVSKLKDKMLKEAEKVRWIPEWAGENRLKNWLLSVKDWVISRQRYWGTPLPIWTCKRCNNQKVIGSKEELKKNMVSGDLGELHRPWIDSVVLVCDRCGGEMVRVSDVMDVWFDSGVAFYASLEYPMNRKYEEMRPVDFIVEGHDQISGWFYSLLRVGIIGFGEVPYRTVLMHGFALDEKGHEMHKSLGNFVSTDEAISLKGRDSFRLYVLSNTPWDDLRYSNKGVEEVFNDLNIAWNVFKFASTYMFLDNFRPRNIREAKLSPEDRWILSRLQEVIRDVTSALEEYKVHIAAKMLRRFIVEDVSRKYIKLIRRRVWLEGENEDKLAVYETLYKVLLDYLRLAAPLIPFFTEYWYQELFRKIDPSLPESIHMNDWPRVDEELSDPLINKLAEIAFTIVESGLLARNKAKIKIRQPLPELRIYTDSEDVERAVRYFESSIKLLINVKSVMVYPKNSSGEVIEYRITPVYS